MNDLRQAAQAVIDRWDSPLWKNGSTADAIADLRTALEQQQAEPVAWMTHSHDLLPLFHRTERAALVWGAEPTPLYTASPQRKPLTDEEIEQAQRDVWRSLPSDFDYTTSSWIEIGIRYAEAAHGIKEGT